MKVTVKAAAKINLTLDIIGKREDGYHELRSIMQSVAIYEYVTLTKNDGNTILISCDKPGIPTDDTNIASRCARAYFKKAGIERIGLEISIRKNIPAQAGMAGGSADGAAVLRGLNEMYNALSFEELCALGATCGADIPFCLMGGTVLCEGIGEKLSRCENVLPDCTLVIIKPEAGISTKEAYDAVDNAGFSGDIASDKLLENMTDIESIAAYLDNAFANALKIGEIDDAVERLKAFDGCLNACMTGSGSAVFGIFKDEEKANKCAKELSGQYSFSKAVKPCRIGTEIVSKEQ